MHVTKQSPKCPECLAFDAKTRSLINDLFSEDEVRVLSVVIAKTVQAGSNALASVPDSQISKIRMQADLDALSCTLGKFVVAMDDLRRQLLIRALRGMGVTIQIQHEVCPHNGEVVEIETKPTLEPA